eukprot:321334-Alexandrium_andersonii.AAC.1
MACSMKEFVAPSGDVSATLFPPWVSGAGPACGARVCSLRDLRALPTSTDLLADASPLNLAGDPC